jgi:hypothetical protein
MHEAFRDHGMHGHASTREGEFGLQTVTRSAPVEPLFIVALLAMAGLSAYGAFGLWFELRNFGENGIQNGRGLGWSVAILSIAVGAALLVALVRSGTVLRAVIATLFVAIALEAVTFCLSLFAFQPRSYPVGPGWGIFLAIATSTCGSVLSMWWFARGFRSLTTRSLPAGEHQATPSAVSPVGTTRIPLAGAPTSPH